MSVRGMHNYRFFVHESFSQKLFARRRNRNHSFGRIQKCGQIFATDKSFKVMWKKLELGHRISHTGRRREYEIAGRRVDGYYESESSNRMQRYMFQFHRHVSGMVVRHVIRWIATKRFRPQIIMYNSRVTSELSTLKTGLSCYRKMGVRFRSGNTWKSRDEWLSQESHANKILSSRWIFRWSHRKHCYPIWNYEYRKNTTYALCIRMYWKRVLFRTVIYWYLYWRGV